jgi:hypothetical protein
MKTGSAASSVSAAPLSPGAVQLPASAIAIIPKLVRQGRRASSAQNFRHAIRAFLIGLVDNSPFREASSGGELSIVFTPSTLLVYRRDHDARGGPALRP